METEPNATSETLRAANYSPEKATVWHFEIEAAILSLETNPFRCPIAVESQFFDEEIRQLSMGKYRVLFTVKDEDVHVLYVRHTAMDYVRPEGMDRDE